MARRSEHSLDEIREMILKAAETIVSEEGFAALKVRNIAMEIGYTVGSVYMVFANMDDLIIHAKARTLDNLAAQLEQSVIGVNVELDLLGLAKTYLHFANDHYNLWSMIFTHRLPDGVEMPDWYQAKVDFMFDQVEQLFNKLAPDKSIQETQQAARALWGGVHGICNLSLIGTLDVVGVNDVESNVVLLVESFIRGWTYSLTNPSIEFRQKESL